MERIDLDHNATTPLDPRVLEVMLPYLGPIHGNPSSLHWYGQQARGAIEQARAQVASLIGASPAEIVFTGSGTEADNLAVRGIATVSAPAKRKVVASSIEHHAILQVVKALSQEGYSTEVIRVGPDGVLDLDHLRSQLDTPAALVAVMLANNETGVIQPVGEAVAIARGRGVLVHCDAVQAVGKMPVDVAELGVDTLALSAHKMYGPKGVGALYLRRGTKLRPLIAGGAQERELRAGTENVAGIVGLGQAAQLAAADLGRYRAVSVLRDRLERRLLALPGTAQNGSAPRVPNTTNVSFGGLRADSLLMALDLVGIAVSTGAACAAGTVEPSHVLRAMGLCKDRVSSALRFSLGRATTEAQVDRAAELVAEIVERQWTVRRARV